MPNSDIWSWLQSLNEIHLADSFFLLIFLVAFTRLYKLLCRLVCWLVGWSVTSYQKRITASAHQFATDAVLYTSFPGADRPFVFSWRWLRPSRLLPRRRNSKGGSVHLQRQREQRVQVFLLRNRGSTRLYEKGRQRGRSKDGAVRRQMHKKMHFPWDYFGAFRRGPMINVNRWIIEKISVTVEHGRRGRDVRDVPDVGLRMVSD